MSKKIFSLKTLLASLAAVCVGAGVGVMTDVKAQATDIPDPQYTMAEKVQTHNDGAMLMLHLTVTDYMTTAWGSSCNADYNWYLKDDPNGKPEDTFGLAEEDIAKYDSLGGQLAYEDSHKYNMPNAPLNKNLDSYNIGEYILLDGVPLSAYDYVMYANRFTLVNTLSIELAEGSTLFADTTELTIKAGCQMPSLYHSYFGQEAFVTFVVEEDQKFRSKNGAWVKAFDFDGYEMDKNYDANEQFFYPRPEGSSLKGHAEAASFGFTDTFDVNNWGDKGFAVQTTTDTVKGNICVFDLVNPIDATEFGVLELYFFSNPPRTFVSHNAYDVTEESLGKAVEKFSIPARTFSKVTLLSELYADENGMIDQLVFEFIDNGDENLISENQFFLGSFTLRENKINTVVYDKSLFIDETEEQYQFTLRFNKKGEISDGETVDGSKVLINGVSLEEINADGQYATASWAEIAGIYQLDITLDKTYAGVAQIKNADLSYTGNKVAVKEGLVFPDGEVLDRTYTCNVYANDIFVDREFISEYQKTSVTSIAWKFFAEEANNINFQIVFDQKLSSQPYLHACDSEGWRESALNDAGWYNAAMSKVFIAGGYKSSLLDSILINGKTLGELHAEDDYATCVFVHYGQIGMEDRINLSVDSNSATYQWLKPLFEAGNGVTIEIKSGLKFPNGVKTTEDVKYVLVNGVLEKVSNEDFTVFFDGKAVADGDVLKTDTAALESSIYVSGDVAYTVTKTADGNVTTFAVEANGKTVTFSVEHTVTKLDPIDKEVEQQSDNNNGIAFGCGSVVSGGLFGGVALALGAAALIGRKRDEENQ